MFFRKGLSRTQQWARILKQLTQTAAQDASATLRMPRALSTTPLAGHAWIPGAQRPATLLLHARAPLSPRQPIHTRATYLASSRVSGSMPAKIAETPDKEQTTKEESSGGGWFYLFTLAAAFWAVRDKYYRDWQGPLFPSWQAALDAGIVVPAYSQLKPQCPPQTIEDHLRATHDALRTHLKTLCTSDLSEPNKLYHLSQALLFACALYSQFVNAPNQGPCNQAIQIQFASLLRQVSALTHRICETSLKSDEVAWHKGLMAMNTVIQKIAPRHPALSLEERVKNMIPLVEQVFELQRLMKVSLAAAESRRKMNELIFIAHDFDAPDWEFSCDKSSDAPQGSLATACLPQGFNNPPKPR